MKSKISSTKSCSARQLHREGRGSAEWALLDYGAFIVHVFGEEARKFYDLERLWRSAPKLVLPDAPNGPQGHNSYRDQSADHAIVQ